MEWEVKGAKKNDSNFDVRSEGSEKAAMLRHRF
jgi:hypothetical protein